MINKATALTMQSDKEVNAVNSEYQYDNRNRLT